MKADLNKIIIYSLFSYTAILISIKLPKIKSLFEKWILKIKRKK